MALIASIDEMQKQWGHIQDKSIVPDYNHVVVKKTPEITDALPERLGDHHVQYLDYIGLIEKCKTLRKRFAVLQIHPIRNNGPLLIVEVSVSWASYGKRGLMLGFSDWSNVEFRYDCAQQAFVISSVKLGGV